jgi:hypothetical protein
LLEPHKILLLLYRAENGNYNSSIDTNPENLKTRRCSYLYLELFIFFQIFSFYSVTQSLSHTVSCYETFTFSLNQWANLKFFFTREKFIFLLFLYLIDIMKGACGLAIVTLENFYSLHWTKKFEKNVFN